MDLKHIKIGNSKLFLILKSHFSLINRGFISMVGLGLSNADGGKGL